MHSWPNDRRPTSRPWAGGAAAWPLPCGAMASGQEIGTAPRRLVFPDGFIWGVATAAHQIEGGNVNNDWWAWEHDPDSGTVASSGDACDSFHRWREDVDLGWPGLL